MSNRNLLTNHDLKQDSVMILSLRDPDQTVPLEIASSKYSLFAIPSAIGSITFCCNLTGTTRNFRLSEIFSLSPVIRKLVYYN